MKEWKYVDTSNNLPDEEATGAAAADNPVILERTLLANTETISLITKDEGERQSHPRFIEPRPRGSSCCPPR